MQVVLPTALVVVPGGLTDAITITDSGASTFAATLGLTGVPPTGAATALSAVLRTLRTLGDPYDAAQIAGAADAVKDKTELDALVAYLQGLGVKTQPAAAGAATAAVIP